MKKFLLLIITIFSTTFAVSLNQTTSYKADIDSQTAYILQKKGAVLIDVRTKNEFESAHPKDAINIPIFHEKMGQRVLNKDFVEQVDYLVKSNLKQEIILICRSGSRSKFAANILVKEGFLNIYNIKNGFTYDWSKTQLPISK